MEIGELYARGGPRLVKNYATARDWYARASDVDGRECFNIAVLYREGGPGLERNYGRAKEWLEKAVGHDPNISSFVLMMIGDLYREGGPGLPRDLAQAEAYAQRAQRYLS